MLPDLLKPRLKLVFCGSAVGTESSIRKAYYAGPGNKFYPILSKTGITTHKLLPEEYGKLLNYDIGLTDLVKNKAGMDHTLNNEDYDIKSFNEKLLFYAPSIVCFNH